MSVLAEQAAPPQSAPAEAPSPTPGQLVLRASALALVLALPRALLTVPRFTEPGVGLEALASRTVLATLSEGLLWLLPLAWLVLVVGTALRRRGQRALGLALPLVVFVLGLAFVSFELPHSSLFALGWQTRSAQVAQGGAAVCALLAAALAAPALRLPLWRALGTLGLLALVLSTALRALPPSRTADWPEQPNIVLISLDTLRPDRLSSYGYDRLTSPNIDRFFESGIRFERTFSPQPFTLTSHATMLTGLEPSDHGVSQQLSLDATVPTLASQLRSAGYATLAVVDGCTFMDQRFGYARGFELYRQVREGAEQKIAQAKQLLEFAGEQPFLLFFHCYDAHSDFDRAPYEAKPEHLAEFVGNYRGDFRGCSPDGTSCASRYLQELNQRGGVLDPEAVEWISDSYDAGIATLDEDLAEFFDYLERTGRLENTVVLLTSDHGEEFYEHDQALHGQHYIENLHVPLLVRTPESVGKSVDVLSGLVDLTPTILDLCGEWRADPDAPLALGQSLAPWITGTPPAAPPRAYLVSESGESVRGIRTERAALVHSVRGWELFDMSLDPLQRHNVVGDPAYRDLERELRGYLAESQARLEARFANRDAGKNRTTIDASERQQLESLGYLGDE